MQKTNSTPDKLSKEEARRIAYRRLRVERAARFPFPIEGRIPNFRGAEAAAELFRTLPVYQQARALKMNPDAPQLPLRAAALKDGKTIFMPAPRLRGAFLRISPENVPQGEERRAASLSHCHNYGDEISLTEWTGDKWQIDLVVTGSAAVARDGSRAGKGEGFGDLEYAILRDLGHPELPVATTVHPAQIVEPIEQASHDLSLDFIVTPTEIIETKTTLPKPSGIHWQMLQPEDFHAMPVLQELRRLRWEHVTVTDIIGPGLDVLFVGLNPGRASAGHGHHFAGPNNHFWRLLHEAGFTPGRYDPTEDHKLLELGYGITNIIDRSSRGEGDLRWSEFLTGAETLREKVRRFRPRIVVLLGKNVYRAYAGLKRSAAVDWGLQERTTVSGVKEFLAPNPSSRSTVRYEDRLHLFKQIRSLIDEV